VRVIAVVACRRVSQAEAGDAADLELMRLIDEQYLKTPFYGARKMAVVLSRSRPPGQAQARNAPGCLLLLSL
jgi:hypothetical protein